MSTRRNIRKGVFETNSSSVHSLVISSDGREPSEFELNEYGEIEIDFGDFGKDYNIYSSQYEKLSYLITLAYYVSHGIGVDGVYNHWEFKKIRDAVCKYTGATGIKILYEIDPYIDHQSIPEYEIDIIDIWDEDQIIDFVFNKYISLKTTCD